MTVNLKRESSHLVNRVHSFHDPVFQELEVAQLDGVVDAVVLQVLVLGGLDEVAGAGHRVSVHVRDATVARDRVESGRSEIGKKDG